MQVVHQHVRRALWATALSALAAAPAFGAGFALLEQSASGLGRAFAGSAAVADDASTVFFNAAGLAEQDSQVVGVFTDIDIKSRFHNAASVAPVGQTSLGDEGGNAGGPNYVPAAYLAWRFSPRTVFGLGLNAPYGLKTVYDDGWLGRFQAIRSDVKTINVNPELAWKLNDHVSVGVGISQQRIDATLTSDINLAGIALSSLASGCGSSIPAAACPAAQAAALGLTGSSIVHGTDSAWGYNAGVLVKFTDATRVGLSYRSAVNYHVEGDVNFALPTSSNAIVGNIIARAQALQLYNGPVYLDLKLPALAIASLQQQIAARAWVTADVSWTGWSTVPSLDVIRTSGAALSSTPEKWKDTWRYALGADAQVSEQWTLRVGAALDQSPVPDATRTPRLPDHNRTWFTAGVSWKPSKVFGADLGYAHLTAKDAALNQDAGNAQLNGLINGTQKSQIDIVSVQGHINF